MMEADVQRRFSSNDSGSGTTEHDGSWQHTRTKFAAEEQQKLEERIKLRVKSRITSMKQKRFTW